MRLKYEFNAIWLIREDGWQYRLEGINSLRSEWDHEGVRWVAEVYRLTPAALDSLRVLLEVANEHRIDLAVETQNY